MFALQALNSSSPSDQARISLYQAELQKALRQASDADSEVSRLQRQASSAQRNAAQAESRVRQLESQSPGTGNASLPAASQLGLYGISLLSGASPRPTVLSVNA
jgi:predicted  nucleic acid-binding Zn-ribbon protein